MLFRSLVIVFTLFPFFAIGQNIVLPEGYTIMAEVDGDLDKDNVPEKVLALTTTDTTALGNVREIRIYKKSGTQWALWHLSRTALYESEAGGMMGDPFDTIAIKKGILIVSQAGGSSRRWYVVDKYRYQNNEFKLIGYTNEFGRPAGEEWTTIDMNLSTGKVIYDKEFTRDEDGKIVVYKREKETVYKKGINITLETRNVINVEIEMPKYGNVVYF